MLEEIKENNEKISLLIDLYENLKNKEIESKEEEETVSIKMKVIKEQILKSTFKIKKSLNKLLLDI